MLALASCGRLGFNDGRSITGDGGPGGSDAVRVVVLTNDTVTPLTPPMGGGMPIAATVLVDRGTGALERLLTDAQGSVTLATDGLVAYHVVHGSGNAWQVTTVATGATGKVQLGGILIAPGGKMSVALPSGGGTTFQASMPRRCADLYDIYGSTVPVSYDGLCEGQMVRMIGFASNNLSNERYIDAGLIQLVQGTTATVTGSYAVMPAYSIKFTNLPAGAQSVAADVLARSDLDLTQLKSGSADSTSVTGTSATLTTAAAPGANALHVKVSMGRAGSAFSSTTEQIASVAFSAPPISGSFDASTLLAPFTAFDFDPQLNLTWAGGSGGTMIIVHLSSEEFTWDAYLPPTATSLAFPTIPADIGFSTSRRVYTVDVTRIDVPGATAVGLTPTIDQIWRRWPSDPALLPASGNRMAQASYISGFVTAP